jgi:hypothetical protein
VKKKVLILAPADFKKINTLTRMIKTLKDHYDVYTAGFSPSAFDDIPFISAQRSVETEMSLADKVWRKVRYGFLKIANDWESRYWIDWRIVNNSELQQHKFDLVIVQNVNFLPIAFSIANGYSKVMFDPQEIYPAEYDANKDWVKNHQPRVINICKKYIPQCDLVSFYAEEVREYYQNFCRIQRHFISSSAGYFHDLQPSEVNPEHINIIHHGIADYNRNLHLAIEMMEHADKRFHYYFMLMVTNYDYFDFLKEKASKNPNVHFLEPVPSDKIVTVINAFDIGHFSIPPVHTNYKFTCPNKYWEFVQARLCVAVGPYVTLKRITEQYQTGLVFNDFSIETQAQQLSALTPEKIMHYKQQSHLNAFELSAAPQAKKILNAVNSLLN